MVLTKATKNVYTLNKRSFLLQPIPFIHAFLAPFISTSLYLLFMYIFLSLFFSHSLYVIFIFFVHSLYILLFYCLSFSLSLSLSSISSSLSSIFLASSSLFSLSFSFSPSPYLFFPSLFSLSVFLSSFLVIYISPSLSFSPVCFIIFPTSLYVAVYRNHRFLHQFLFVVVKKMLDHCFKCEASVSV